MSLHLFTVSNKRNVSPTLKRVARQRAIRRRVGGPGAPCMCLVSCSTSFCWHPLISLCNSEFRLCFNRRKTLLKVINQCSHLSDANSCNNQQDKENFVSKKMIYYFYDKKKFVRFILSHIDTENKIYY